MKFERSSGILMHVSALHSEFGIGDLGESAKQFIDYLHASKVHLWQVLPLGPTPDDGCPYASYSAFAGNPLLVDPKGLVEMGLLFEHDITADVEESSHVDYALIKRMKTKMMKNAFLNYHIHEHDQVRYDFTRFCQEESYWLDDYALYAAIKHRQGEKPWFDWPEELRSKNDEAIMLFHQEEAEQIEFEKFQQFLFSFQWNALWQYAKDKGVQIVGDIPIYVAHDSSDVWSHPEVFDLTETGDLKTVAGVPPDYFSETGQLWGNPTYNWSYLEHTAFAWWVERFKHLLRYCDVVRIDHFRAFSTYWSVPAGEKTAINGEWCKAPGYSFFKTLEKELGRLPIMAEDLGDIDQDVIDLRDHFEFPGMKILQFAFDSGEKNNFLPMYYDKNTVVYTGTHDNDTVLGWFENASIEDQTYALDYLGGTLDNVVSNFIRGAWASVSLVAFTTVQDLLKLGEEARFNVPGTVEGNWSWKMTKAQFDSLDAALLHKLNKLYDRDNLLI